ncbi:DUF1659 domain-containing protein [Tepidibacter hydrothermalis]|uniref:DUF1659 domain-containing protein n=1 Tax=Tepidibacter hydrothermalis TaxID=3036126 RepID=A0ABY8EIB8_9FIRM|nr:DUF1659 domain-containing protein [Tepidibacter hydrothermalis]WFD10543.1 DUF1659 domain-containing protein [Tepidibacter hydrothermalis]
MAITSIKTGTSLKLKYSLGLNEKGVEKFKTTSIKNLSLDATDDDLFGMTTLMKDMQSNSLVDVKKVVDTDLSE